MPLEKAMPHMMSCPSIFEPNTDSYMRVMSESKELPVSWRIWAGTRIKFGSVGVQIGRAKEKNRPLEMPDGGEASKRMDPDALKVAVKDVGRAERPTTLGDVKVGGANGRNSRFTLTNIWKPDRGAVIPRRLVEGAVSAAVRQPRRCWSVRSCQAATV